MISTTRNKESEYQYKMVSVANDTAFLGAGPKLCITLPPNLVEIKALNMIATLQFDESTAVGKRIVSHIGGNFTLGGDGKLVLPNDKLIEVNKTADSDRIVHINKDLTSLADGLLQDITTEWDQPAMPLGIVTNNDLTTGFTSGKILLWKIDIVYTVQ